MTCIAAVKHNNKVYLGGDSALVDLNNGNKVKLNSPKVFRCYEYIIGYAGSARMGQLLQNYFEPTDPPDNPEELEFHMVTTFIDELRAVAEEKALRLDASDEQVNDFAQIIVGVNGRIFVIEEDWQASEWAYDYAAIGSGCSAALGSLYTTHKLGVDPEIRVKYALMAATEHTLTVSEPYHMVIK
jgi:ATP-dependent protease HslVU (ClpYQ) peptidase subunit